MFVQNKRLTVLQPTDYNFWHKCFTILQKKSNNSQVLHHPHLLTSLPIYLIIYMTDMFSVYYKQDLDKDIEDVLVQAMCLFASFSDR